MAKIMDWYADRVDGASVNAVAERTGLVQSTLNRQVRAGALSHETVVAVAREYGGDALDALVMSGLINREDIRRHGVAVLLESLTDAEIAGEVMRRMSGGPHPDFE